MCLGNGENPFGGFLYAKRICLQNFSTWKVSISGQKMDDFKQSQRMFKGTQSPVGNTTDLIQNFMFNETNRIITFYLKKNKKEILPIVWFICHTKTRKKESPNLGQFYPIFFR